MFKHVLKWVGALVIIVAAIGAGIFLRAQSKFSSMAEQTLEDPSLKLAVTSAPEWAQEGERIAKMKGCFDCHGKDLGGTVFVQDPAIGMFAGPNLTKGQGGVVSNYTDEDWVRSIRFGRGPQKHYLKFMPSQEFAFLTDEDLSKLITYLKNVPAVNREFVPVQVGPMAKILYSFGKMPLLFSGENVDPNSTVPASLKPSEAPEYGKYLAASCVGCHHPNFGGGKIPGVPPSWPKSANLTAKGNIAKWSFADFQKTASSGVTPEGKSLNPQFMPWPAMAAMNETELKALYNFLKSLPEASENQ